MPIQVIKPEYLTWMTVLGIIFKPTSASVSTQLSLISKTVFEISYNMTGIDG